jgi:pilus assembly protein Flp/PilA
MGADMSRIQRILKFFADEETGATAIEYAVMLALIVGAILGSVTTLSQKTASSFNNTSSKLQNSAFGG